jgi:membrane-associated protein
MLALVEQLVEWAGPVFASGGYAIVVTAVLLERSIFIGLFVPGDVILALGGIYAARGSLDLVTVMALGMVGAACGESLGYWLGRRYGRGLIRRLPLVNRLEGRLDASQEYFRAHGGMTVVVGRYATAAGAFVPFVAGVSRMGYPRFLAFDLPAIALWAVAITLVGYLFESQLDLVDRILSRFGWIMLGTLVVLIGGRILWKRLRERQTAPD